MGLVDFVRPIVPKALILVVRALLLSKFKHNPYDFEATFAPDHESTTHDFIVVGAGCAGSTLGARLSETSADVLLLQAGGNAPPESAVPFLSTPLMVTGDKVWRFKTKPQKNSMFSYNKRGANVFVGKVMGGNTAVNGMVYTRGSPGDYDHWRDLGNPGWGFQDLRPYFDKSIEYLGAGSGPLSVERRRTTTGVTSASKAAAKELGIKELPDFFAGIGIRPVVMVTKKGVRHTASEAFLTPAIDRPNLRVVTPALATKILFNSENRAIGVAYTRNGKQYVARARKEVIVSGGAFKTPQLLMLSGIGPAEHLTENGINVRVDSPGVGANMNDHPNVYITWQVKKGGSSSFLDPLKPWALLGYLKKQTGILSDSPGLEMNHWINTEDSRSEWPDVQLSISSFSYAADRGIFMAQAVDMKRSVFNELYGEYLTSETLTINPNLARPYSRGSVRLRSSNPEDDPVVDSNYFDDPRDMAAMVKGIRHAFKIAESRAMKKSLNPETRSKGLSACSKHEYGSDAYWECYARNTASSLWHFSGTAKMGPATDPTAVLDNRLRVRGAQGLRVVDASVFPQVPVTNSMASVYAVAEKAADLIKEDWGYETAPGRAEDWAEVERLADT